MASLRPSSRFLSHQLSRITSSSASQAVTHTRTLTSTSSFRPTTSLLLSNRRSHIHISRTLRREPQDPLDRVPPRSFASNDAYPDGAPGEPKAGESLPSGIAPSTLYTFSDIQSISSSPQSFPNKLLIDVREPSELLATGRIPNAVNVPIGSAPDAFFMSSEDFEDKYGFARPEADVEVIFYCKAGVRSRAAARLAGQGGFGGKVGEFPGSWVEWEKNGGEVQKE